MPKIISRKEAQARGLKRYFTGKPCPHGHISEKLVSNRRCVVCLQQDRERWGKDNPDRLSAREARYYRERPGRREKQIAQGAQWAKDHPEETRVHKARYRNANREKTRAAVRRSKDAKPEHYNGLASENSAFRRAGPACPPWADRKAIATFYIARPPGKTVDHIIPHGSAKRPAETVEGYPIRGLHVLWNLQYITLDENQTKKVRMTPQDQVIAESATLSGRPRIKRPLIISIEPAAPQAASPTDFRGMVSAQPAMG